MSDKKYSVGRPKKYKTNEELQAIIEEYLNSTDFNIWTITGLGISIGLDRHQLINYGKEQEFYHTIKNAKALIHNSYEVSLRSKGDSGSIFGLKNFGWRDKQEIEIAKKDTTVLDAMLKQLE